MTAEESLTTRKSLSDLITVLVCLCAFSLFSCPQMAVLSWGQVTQGEAPVQEDGENSEKELEVLSSARHRLKKRRHSFICQLLNSSNRPRKTNSFARPHQVIIGHQFANGLCAPLLV